MSKQLAPEDIIVRIKKALALDGTHTWDDLVRRCKEGNAQIFWNEHGAWVTEVVPFPQTKHLNVWVVAGELPEVMELQEKVKAFGREQGCTRMTAVARKGWKNVAREYGWSEPAVVLTQEL